MAVGGEGWDLRRALTTSFTPRFRDLFFAAVGGRGVSWGRAGFRMLGREE